jgi:hypothetical protein
MLYKMKSRSYTGRDFQVIGHYHEEKNKYLRSAALTVAVLVLFVVGISLAALFRLLLFRLTVRLAPSGLASLLTALTGLPSLLAFFELITLLTLFELITLLTLLLRIFCHELPSWESAGLPTPSKFIAIHKLVAARDYKVAVGLHRL